MDFVRWATGADEPAPWPFHVVAWLVVFGGGLFLLLREWFRG